MAQVLRRLVSALLLALVAGGGGRLPTVDALAFHEAVANPDAFRSHFEASSLCHDDGCSVRSVAHESRQQPAVATPAPCDVRPDLFASPAAPPPLRSAAHPTSHLSRAPPLFA